MKRILIALATLAALSMSALADQPRTVGHPFGLGLPHQHRVAVKIKVAGTAQAATTSSSVPTPINPLTALANITLADLQNALKESNAQVPSANSPLIQPPYNSTVTANSDSRHGNCWAALIQFVTGWQNGVGNILPNQLGLATAAQTYFDDQNLLGKPLIPDYVVTNCALTVADLQTSFANLALAVGIKAAPLPSLPIIP